MTGSEGCSTRQKWQRVTKQPEARVRIHLLTYQLESLLSDGMFTKNRPPQLPAPPGPPPSSPSPGSRWSPCRSAAQYTARRRPGWARSRCRRARPSSPATGRSPIRAPRACPGGSCTRPRGLDGGLHRGFAGRLQPDKPAARGVLIFHDLVRRSQIQRWHIEPIPANRAKMKFSCIPLSAGGQVKRGCLFCLSAGPGASSLNRCIIHLVARFILTIHSHTDHGRAPVKQFQPPAAFAFRFCWRGMTFFQCRSKKPQQSTRRYRYPGKRRPPSASSTASDGPLSSAQPCAATPDPAATSTCSSNSSRPASPRCRPSPPSN